MQPKSQVWIEAILAMYIACIQLQSTAMLIHYSQCHMMIRAFCKLLYWCFSILVTVIGRAKVTFEYKAEAADELDLTVGCIIEITDKEVSDGWWEGCINGKVGVFPDNFVQLLPDEPPQKTKEPAKEVA